MSCLYGGDAATTQVSSCLYCSTSEEQARLENGRLELQCTGVNKIYNTSTSSVSMKDILSSKKAFSRSERKTSSSKHAISSFFCPVVRVKCEQHCLDAVITAHIASLIQLHRAYTNKNPNRKKKKKKFCLLGSGL